MWTYFVLFLGITALAAIFVRKAILLHVKKSRGAAAASRPDIKDAAEETIEISKISKSDKTKIEALLAQADQMLKNGEEEQAVKVLVQALAIDSNHIEAQQKLAMLYLQKQMFGAAAALFKQLADLTQDPVHYSHLGFVLFQQNSYEDARAAYQKAVDIDPSRPQRFVSLAQVYRSLGQPQNAVIALGKAIELDNENIEFLLLLTELYAELNNLEEAELALKNVLEKTPDNVDALALLKKLQKEKEGS